MVNQQPPAFMQNLSTHTAELFRRAMGFAFPLAGTSGTFLGGVKAQGDWLASGTANLSVNFAAGEAIIPGGTGAFQGPYYCLNDATLNVGVGSNSSGNPRVDRGCGTQTDAFYSGSTNTWSQNIVTGTPAGSPVEPSLPTSSIPICSIAVANGASSTTGQVTDQRIWPGLSPLFVKNVMTPPAGFTPANPTGSASTAGVMMGLAISYTPTGPGYLNVIMVGSAESNTGIATGQIQMRFGTGTAPANQAANTGTAFGPQTQYSPPAAGTSFTSPWSLCGKTATPVTAGTPAWVDVSLLTSNASDTQVIGRIGCLVWESF